MVSLDIGVDSDNVTQHFCGNQIFDYDVTLPIGGKTDKLTLGWNIGMVRIFYV